MTRFAWLPLLVIAVPSCRPADQRGRTTRPTLLRCTAAIRELTMPEEAGNAFPTAINERGEVTGYWSEIEAPTWHAFAHRDGETRRLVEND